ncbi:LysE family translocator [Glutamicibacter sp.]|uniref:LysE family translocator n=1 Tax=Glutamicibacter sp. TaxID=1931995 RepID=UPI003D6A578A
MACTPGADWAYIFSSALSKTSYRPAIWGLLAGYLVHTALLVCGIAALVASSPSLLLWLTAAGSVYLLWLGIATLRSCKNAKFFDPAAPSVSETEVLTCDSTQRASARAESSLALLDKVQQRSRGSQFIKGLLTSGTNPKALLLYVALIPQYLDSSQALPLSLQTGALGLTHFTVSILVYFFVAMAARALLSSRPLAARIVTLCSGIIMILLSAGLIYEQFFVA